MSLLDNKALDKTGLAYLWEKIKSLFVPINEDGKIDLKYLPEIRNKEYFPDYAAWQKPGAKKGALVLWSPISTEFGYNKTPKDFKIEIGNFKIISSGEEDHILYYSGQITLKTLILLISKLKEEGLIDEDSEIPLKFGLLNAIHFGIEEFPLWRVAVGNFTYPLETVEIEQNRHEFQNYYFTELSFLCPVKDLLLFNDVEDCIITGINSIGSYDALRKLKDLLELKVYTTVESYFNKYCEKPIRNFYILQYYKIPDLWKLILISQREVKVKYHKTMVSIDKDNLCRRTYRLYLSGFIKVFDDYILFSDQAKGILKFPIEYPEEEYEEDGEIVYERIPKSLPKGSFLIKRRVHTHTLKRKYIWTYRGILWGNKYPLDDKQSYRFVGIYPNVKERIGRRRSYIFYGHREYILQTKRKNPFIWFKIPIFRVYENGTIAFAYYLHPKIMY